jgi:hypothetical protein
MPGDTAAAQASTGNRTKLPEVDARELRSTDSAQWEQFVAKHPDSNLYHTLHWQALVCEVFGHEPVYLLAERAGELRAVLPMFLVRMPWLRSARWSKLLSMPYDIGAGGALALDEEAEAAVVARAIEIARARNVAYLELRCGSARPALASLPLRATDPIVISDVELDEAPAVWARVAEDHRKAVRKAEKRGVLVREATTLAEFRAFHDIYLRVFRDFGTPPYGDDYFPALFQRLHAAGQARLLLAQVGTRWVGGLLLFSGGRNLVSKFAACLPDAVPLRAYAALYAAAIDLGLALRMRTLSFGTSSRDQTGLIEFKERWGARTRPTTIYALPVRRDAPDLAGFYDSTHWTRRLWRRLPLRVTRIGGDALNRWYC